MRSFFFSPLASVDIDKLIEEGDTSQLVELIRPVTFCKADSEFDSSRIKIDPAFIKVFRISQLISEFLLASQESSIEKLNNLQEKYNETEHEKEKLSEKILHLKESLTSAKKELKKRTETLASTQSEMLGENNRDEFDQVTNKVNSSHERHSHFTNHFITHFFASQNSLVSTSFTLSLVSSYILQLFP